MKQEGVITRPYKRVQLLPQGEPIALSDIRDALVIKEDDLFLMTDTEGNLPRGSGAGYGLYKGDTRYLSAYDLSFEDIRPVVLLSTAELGFSSEHHLTNPPMATSERTIPKESVEVRRQRVINDSLLETIQVTNFNIFRVTLNLRFDLDADFVDIFEVRGQKRPRRGRLAAPILEKNKITFKYKGLDGVWRSTEVKFSPAPNHIWYNGALFSISLRHRESMTITVRFTLDNVQDEESFPSEFEKLNTSYREWLSSNTNVFTNNEFFNAMLQRSLSDIRVLSMSRNDSNFVAAGTPWFDCLFGRDSIITSIQMLAYNPQIARNTLRILAKWQGKKVDPWRDEQPGKILHELRVGEMAALGEIPMTPYYGSVDSTPLFIMLAAEYLSWTADLDLIRELEPNLMAALEWIDIYGDFDKCGYVEYAKRSPKGLINQGWKDSRDGIINGDGTLVRPPIALVEVQGYVYAAKQNMAWMLTLLGENQLARKLRRESAALRKKFNHDFWMEDVGYFGLAIGAHKQLATTITSNPGHGLWTGIIDVNLACEVVEQLFSNDLFSGWGIRTLSSRAARYNPLGYHLGTVWPHDNAIIGMGLKKYGFKEELNELFTALYDACRSFDYYRLPELFSGAARTAHNLPVRYPVACRPQAWAAGTIPMLLQAALGLAPNAMENRLRLVLPRLPHWLEEVEIRGLRIGEGSVDLSYRRRRGRTEVSVESKRGLRVSLVKNWPGIETG